MIRLAVTSDTMPVEDMTILVEDQVVDALAAVNGVADVQTYGDRAKIFRIDIDQAKIASHGLTIADIRNALASIAFDTPAGSITTRCSTPGVISARPSRAGAMGVVRW